VTRAECGTQPGVNTCLKCGSGATYDCEECCPGCEATSSKGYTYCTCGKKPPAPAPAPAPGPAPGNKCETVLEEMCGAAAKHGAATCSNCLKSHWSEITAAGCSISVAEGFCKGGGPSPSPSPPKPTDHCDTYLETTCGAAAKQGVSTCDKCLKTHWTQIIASGCSEKAAVAFCSGGKPGPSPPGKGSQFTPYPKTYLPPGQTSAACPTGLMFNASWPEGSGSGPSPSGYGHMPYSMLDEVKVPRDIGRYILSWRWDCEQTPQVWNSCADILIE